MGTKFQIIAFLFGLIFLVSILRYLRKKSYNPSLSILWVVIALFLISIPIFEPFYRWLSYDIFGLLDARTIIYVVLIGFILIYIFNLTLKISLMEDQLQSLISYTAILEKEINDIKKK